MRVFGWLLMLVLAVHARGAAADVWMTHMRPELLAQPGSQWTWVRQRLGAVEFYINTISSYIPADDLKRLVPVLRQNKIKIAIECGYFDWDNKCRDYTAPNPKGMTDFVREQFDTNLGEETAQIEMLKIRNLLDAGGIPDYLNLDGPVRRMMHPGTDIGRHVNGLDSIDRAVAELVDYMRAWKRKFPKIKFFALTNFPNWGWKGESSYWGGGMFYGDYYEVLTKIIAKTKAAGIPIAGVTTDNPYEFFTGQWPHKAWMDAPWQLPSTREPSDPSQIDWSARLLELQQLVKSEGLEFNLIVNSCGGGGSSSEAFCTGTLDYLDAYSKAGGSADRYIVQSWYKYPEEVVPATTPYTMTWLVKKVMERLNQAPAH